MSLFPVVSQVDAVDANYVTIKTAKGFLVHWNSKISVGHFSAILYSLS